MSIGKPAAKSDRETFPKLREDLGEDPARYLDVPMFAEGGGTTRLATAMVRIRGIDKLEVANAWLVVERPNDLPTEDGPERYRRREIREDVPCEYSGFEGQLRAGETAGGRS